MYSGAVEDVGTILEINKKYVNSELKIYTKKLSRFLKYGKNISINGITCVVIKNSRNTFTASVMTEIMRKSNLKFLTKNSQVNIERSIRLGQELNNHIVLGRIDEIGIIQSIKVENSKSYIAIKTYKKIIKSLTTKGMVIIDGVGLVVNELKNDILVVEINDFDIKTTLHYKKIGDIVNIEIDIIQKYIERAMEARRILNLDNKDYTAANMDFLRLNGFL